MLLLGFDIGGTKCAVVTANWDGEHIELLKKEKCPTDLTVSPEEMLARLMEMADGIVINKADGDNIEKAKLAQAHFKNALHLFPPTASGWSPQVLTYSGYYDI